MCGRKKNRIPFLKTWDVVDQGYFLCESKAIESILKKIVCICSSVGSKNSPVDVGSSILELTKISLSWFLQVSSSIFRFRDRGSGVPLFSWRLSPFFLEKQSCVLHWQMWNLFAFPLLYQSYPPKTLLTHNHIHWWDEEARRN